MEGILFTATSYTHSKTQATSILRPSRRIAGASYSLPHPSVTHPSICLLVAEPVSNPFCLTANQKTPSETGEPGQHLQKCHPDHTLSFAWILPVDHNNIIREGSGRESSNPVICFTITWHHLLFLVHALDIVSSFIFFGYYYYFYRDKRHHKWLC